jgi:hypothetical protein
MSENVMVKIKQSFISNTKLQNPPLLQFQTKRLTSEARWAPAFLRFFGLRNFAASP